MVGTVPQTGMLVVNHELNVAFELNTVAFENINIVAFENNVAFEIFERINFERNMRSKFQ